MSLRRMTVCLSLLAAACSGPAPRSAAPAATASPTPSGPSVDIDKVEEIEGWIRFKRAKEANVKIAVQGDTVTFGDGASGFTVPKADYRADTGQDFVEVQLGAKIKPVGTPTTQGPAGFSQETLRARIASECANKPTVCIALWNGCGVVACDGSGTVIGACCGGWTAASSPN